MPDTSQGLFVHAARPAEIGSDRHPEQHYFGRNGHNCVEKRTVHGTARVMVLRFTDEDAAQVSIDSNVRHASTASIMIRLSADEMQSLACALLDAAHELRTQPATAPVTTEHDGGAS